jgi:hypothetical protein
MFNKEMYEKGMQSTSGTGASVIIGFKGRKMPV